MLYGLGKHSLQGVNQCNHLSIFSSKPFDHGDLRLYWGQTTYEDCASDKSSSSSILEHHLSHQWVRTTICYVRKEHSLVWRPRDTKLKMWAYSLKTLISPPSLLILIPPPPISHKYLEKELCYKGATSLSASMWRCAGGREGHWWNEVDPRAFVGLSGSLNHDNAANEFSQIFTGCDLTAQTFFCQWEVSVVCLFWG